MSESLGIVSSLILNKRAKPLRRDRSSCFRSTLIKGKINFCKRDDAKYTEAGSVFSAEITSFSS